jgi:arylsulfatase A-like enzyme/Flp pilus assembly protein TadD
VTRSISIVVLLMLISGCGDFHRTARPNIILISMDTTRADHLGCYGHDGIRTPAIDSLASTSVRYERCYAPVPITLPSHTSMLSGQYPIRHSVRDNGTFTVPAQVPTLATILGDRGWRTIGVIGAFPLSERFGFARGFQDWNEDFTTRPQDLLPLAFDQRTAEQVTSEALHQIDNDRDRPFFLFVHYYDPHRPWTAPALFGRRYRGSPYLAEIAYTDMAIGRLLNGLRERGHLENAIVVLTADHGEGLGDHEEATHSYLVYDETTRVPFLLSGPGINPGVVRTPVSLVDIAPTILDLVNIEPPTVMDGRSLLGPQPPDRPVFVESLAGRLHHGWNDVRGIVVADHKYIIGHGTLLFDIDQDPSESRDLSQMMPDLANDLDRELRSFITSGQGPISLEEAFTKADLDVRNRLEALGYIVNTGNGADMDWSELGPITAAGDPRRHLSIVELQSIVRALVSEGDIPLAMETVARGLEDHPEDIDLLRLLLIARLKVGDALGAAAASERLQAVSKMEPRDDVLCAVAAMAVGDIEAALRFSERAADVSDDSRELRVHARALTRAGRTGDALVVVRRILDREPCETMTLHDLAKLYRFLGDTDAARTTYERMLECAPYDPSPLVNLGNMAVEDGHIEAARALYLEAARIAPNYALAHYSIGALAFESGDWDDARESLRRALSLAPVSSPVGRNAAAMIATLERSNER